MIALGIEFSTQSVKTLALDVRGGNVIHTDSFKYDDSFPFYGTVGGVLPNSDASVRHTSPLMLLEAVDRALMKLRSLGIAPRVKAVKIDAMQHCTVYVDGTFAERLKTLDPSRPLAEHVGPALTRKSSPIWEDRSTAHEVLLLNESLKKQGGVAKLCGNLAEPRFPAPQILKWAYNAPQEFEVTAHIFVLSAFLSSILAGKPVAVDTGDGWGTNFNNLDINTPGWNDEILKAFDNLLRERGIAGAIKNKIGGIVPYDTPLGHISPCISARYGIDPDAIILAGTGDNPATLLGCGGGAVVSLGSSYTVNGIAADIAPSPSGEYNLFGYTSGTVMALSVFTNGSKVHDYFREKYDPLGERDSYMAMAGKSVISNQEPLMLPWLFDESVPPGKRGIIRQGLNEDDPAANIRALHISQVLALRLHSGHLERRESLCVAGGASKNGFLRQLISDFFGAETYTIENTDFAAPLGCAVSGACCLLDISYAEAANRFVRKEKSSVLRPIEKNRKVVDRLLQRYSELENANRN
ncbi:MAG: FGGY family carbohydrate kinase [Deltaproteobacteria bacterium]|nr:FGGY family carbohydrate kinase [Deltaproteobacteria bacterium]